MMLELTFTDKLWKKIRKQEKTSTVRESQIRALIKTGDVIKLTAATNDKEWMYAIITDIIDCPWSDVYNCPLPILYTFGLPTDIYIKLQEHESIFLKNEGFKSLKEFSKFKVDGEKYWKQHKKYIQIKFTTTTFHKGQSK